MLRVLFHFVLALVIAFQCFLPVNSFALMKPVTPPVALARQTLNLVGLNFPQNESFQLNFIFDSTESIAVETDQDNISKTIDYFLTALTITDEDKWVNLSPYESQRIINPSLAKTSLGKDMLVQDLVLKQKMGEILDPKHPVGKKFWEQIFTNLGKDYEAEDFSVATFHKIWIAPDKAELVFKDGNLVITESRLKVLLDADHQLRSYFQETDNVVEKQIQKDPRYLKIMKELIVPEMERLVNEEASFAKLRRIYHANIFATWLKKKFTEHNFIKQYSNQEILMGLEDVSQHHVQTIYQNYLEVLEESQSASIREQYNPTTQQLNQQQYLTGGVLQNIAKINTFRIFDRAQIAWNNPMEVKVDLAVDQAAVAVEEQLEAKAPPETIDSYIPNLLYVPIAEIHHLNEDENKTNEFYEKYRTRGLFKTKDEVETFYRNQGIAADMSQIEEGALFVLAMRSEVFSYSNEKHGRSNHKEKSIEDLENGEATVVVKGGGYNSRFDNGRLMFYAPSTFLNSRRVYGAEKINSAQLAAKNAQRIHAKFHEVKDSDPVIKALVEEFGFTEAPVLTPYYTIKPQFIPIFNENSEIEYVTVEEYLDPVFSTVEFNEEKKEKHRQLFLKQLGFYIYETPNNDRLFEFEESSEEVLNKIKAIYGLKDLSEGEKKKALRRFIASQALVYRLVHDHLEASFGFRQLAKNQGKYKIVSNTNLDAKDISLSGHIHDWDGLKDDSKKGWEIPLLQFHDARHVDDVIEHLTKLLGFDEGEYRQENKNLFLSFLHERHREPGNQAILRSIFQGVDNDAQKKIFERNYNKSFIPDEILPLSLQTLNEEEFNELIEDQEYFQSKLWAFMTSLLLSIMSDEISFAEIKSVVLSGINEVKSILHEKDALKGGALEEITFLEENLTTIILSLFYFEKFPSVAESYFNELGLTKLVDADFSEVDVYKSEVRDDNSEYLLLEDAKNTDAFLENFNKNHNSFEFLSLWEEFLLIPVDVANIFSQNKIFITLRIYEEGSYFATRRKAKVYFSDETQTLKIISPEVVIWLSANGQIRVKKIAKYPKGIAYIPIQIDNKLTAESISELGLLTVDDLPEEVQKVIPASNYYVAASELLEFREEQELKRNEEAGMLNGLFFTTSDKEDYQISYKDIVRKKSRDQFVRNMREQFGLESSLAKRISTVSLTAIPVLDEDGMMYYLSAEDYLAKFEPEGQLLEDLEQSFRLFVPFDIYDDLEGLVEEVLSTKVDHTIEYFEKNPLDIIEEYGLETEEAKHRFVENFVRQIALDLHVGHRYYRRVFPYNADGKKGFNSSNILVTGQMIDSSLRTKDHVLATPKYSFKQLQEFNHSAAKELIRKLVRILNLSADSYLRLFNQLKHTVVSTIIQEYALYKEGIVFPLRKKDSEYFARMITDYLEVQIDSAEWNGSFRDCYLYMNNFLNSTLGLNLRNEKVELSFWGDLVGKFVPSFSGDLQNYRTLLDPRLVMPLMIITAYERGYIPAAQRWMREYKEVLAEVEALDEDDPVIFDNHYNHISTMASYIEHYFEFVFINYVYFHHQNFPTEISESLKEIYDMINSKDRDIPTYFNKKGFGSAEDLDREILVVAEDGTHYAWITSTGDRVLFFKKLGLRGIRFVPHEDQAQLSQDNSSLNDKIYLREAHKRSRDPQIKTNLRTEMLSQQGGIDFHSSLFEIEVNQTYAEIEQWLKNIKLTPGKPIISLKAEIIKIHSLN